jgi:hypothetical protein
LDAGLCFPNNIILDTLRVKNSPIDPSKHRTVPKGPHVQYGAREVRVERRSCQADTCAYVKSFWRAFSRFYYPTVMGNPATALGKRKSTRPIILSSDEEGTDKTYKSEDSNSTFKDAIRSKTHRVSSEKLSTKLARLNSVNNVFTGRSKLLRPLHSVALHSTASALLLRDDLLTWYDKVKNVRGMPWRKDYDSRLSGEAQTQRTYEVLVSEIMLQQTQMFVPTSYVTLPIATNESPHRTTVIPYYNRWMDVFPTVEGHH